MAGVLGRRGILLASMGVLAKPALADRLSTVGTARRLRMAIAEDDPPFAFRREDGELDGFDLHLGLALARGLESEPILLPRSGPGALAQALAGGEADLIVSGLPVSPEAARSLRFATPVTARPLVLVAPRSASLSPATGLRGRRVALGLAVAPAVVEQLARRWRFEPSRDLAVAEALAQVESGEAAAALVDGFAFRHRAARHPALREAIEVLTLPVAPALPHGEPRLLAAVNEVLGELARDGTVDLLLSEFAGDLGPRAGLL